MLVGWEKRSELTRIRQLRSAIPALCLGIRRGARTVLHSYGWNTEGVSALGRLLTAFTQDCSCPRRRTRQGPGESIQPAVSGTPVPDDVEDKTSTAPAATYRVDRFRTDDPQTVRRVSCAPGPRAPASSLLAPMRSTPSRVAARRLHPCDPSRTHPIHRASPEGNHRTGPPGFGRSTTCPARSILRTFESDS